MVYYSSSVVSLLRIVHHEIELLFDIHWLHQYPLWSSIVQPLLQIQHQFYSLSLDIVIIVIFILSVIIGLYQSWKKVAHDIDVAQSFILYSASLLLISSSLPLSIYILGLAHLKLATYQSIITLISPIFIHIYNIFFILILIWQIIDFWQGVVLSTVLRSSTEVPSASSFSASSFSAKSSSAKKSFSAKSSLIKQQQQQQQQQLQKIRKRAGSQSVTGTLQVGRYLTTSDKTSTHLLRTSSLSKQQQKATRLSLIRTLSSKASIKDNDDDNNKANGYQWHEYKVLHLSSSNGITSTTSILNWLHPTNRRIRKSTIILLLQLLCKCIWFILIQLFKLCRLSYIRHMYQFVKNMFFHHGKE